MKSATTIKGRDVLIHSLAGVALPLRARQEFTADARNDASKDQGWKRKGVGCVGGLSVSCRAAHERRAVRAARKRCKKPPRGAHCRAICAPAGMDRVSVGRRPLASRTYYSDLVYSPSIGGGRPAGR